MADSPSSLKDFAARHGLDPEATAELSALMDSVVGQEWHTRDWADTYWNRTSPSDGGEGVRGVQPASRDSVSSDDPGSALSPVSLALGALSAQLDEATRDEADPLVGLPDRYVDMGFLGRGGMGEVRRVLDSQLNRSVALKILHPKYVGEELVARFIEEAQVTAQLEHPSIVPVHDVGRLSDGRIFFTMKEVQGDTLRTAIQEVHEASEAEAWAPAPSGWTFRRLVDAFHRVCEAVSYAHARRVIHRDLKPANVMVGHFGQVLVLDWGLAKVLGEHAAQQQGDEPTMGDLASDSGLEPVQSDRADRYATRAGVVGGTILYMPPEQALGMSERVGPQADVYALGAILYEIIAGRPPYDVGTPSELFGAALKGLGTAPGRLVGGDSDGGGRRQGRPIPAELWALCRRCLMFAVGERPRNAGEVAVEVSAWLEGARRREAALDQIAQAERLGPTIEEQRARADALRHQAHELLAELPKLAPSESKRIAWRLEDDAVELERSAELAEVRLLQSLRGALTQVPELDEAHTLLADHYQKRHAAAEAAGDDHAAARAEALLRSHDRGQHAAWLEGRGRLSLHTEPPGALATLHRYVLEDRRLVDEPLTVLGTTPLEDLPLDHGSYLVVLRKDGFVPARYPIRLGRQEHWDGRLPETTSPTPVPLLPIDGSVEGAHYVPQGWFLSGGDARANGTLPQRRVWVDGFLMQARPVTNTEYIRFLDELVDAGREVEALRWAPRERSSSPGEEGALIYGRDEDGHFVLVPDAEGDVWSPEWPVMMVSWSCARAYAAWFAERTGRPWRLPSELEWEKAARGVDGRAHPWGPHREPTWAVVNDSHVGRMLPAPAEAPATDRSVYGIGGLGGNVRDWCRESFTDDGPSLRAGRLVIGEEDDAGETEVRVTRGGAWYANPRDVRCASRIRAAEGLRAAGVGIRLVFSWPGNTEGDDP